MPPKDEKTVPIFNDAVQIQVRNRVLDNQSEEIAKNERLIENVDVDLTTMRRQVEIIEDSSLRKANHLFLLKTVMTFAGLLFIPILLSRQSIISETNSFYSIIAIIVIYFIIVFYNMSSVWVRNNNRFSLRNFLTKVKKGDGITLPKRTCISKVTTKKSDEEIELENKLKKLQALEMKFSRVKPNINLIDNRAKTVQDRIEQIKSEIIKSNFALILLIIILSIAEGGHRFRVVYLNGVVLAF
jgi:hypothetical protein